MLSALPKPLDPEELADTVNQYIQTGQFRDKLIIHNARLAIAIANSYGHSDWNRCDDLRGVALLQLVLSVDSFRSKAHDTNLIYYVAPRIRYGVINELRSNQVCSPRTARRAKGRKVIELGDKIPLILDNHLDRIEMREIIEMAATTPFEREIFYMKGANYTDTEIANAVGWSLSMVQRVKTKIFDKFIQLWRADDGDAT